MSQAGLAWQNRIFTTQSTYLKRAVLFSLIYPLLGSGRGHTTQLAAEAQGINNQQVINIVHPLHMYITFPTVLFSRFLSNKTSPFFLFFFFFENFYSLISCGRTPFLTFICTDTTSISNAMHYALLYRKLSN